MKMKAWYSNREYKETAEKRYLMELALKELGDFEI
jgi:hypothetical protein